jgi:hypothetical protein
LAGTHGAFRIPIELNSIRNKREECLWPMNGTYLQSVWQHVCKYKSITLDDLTHPHSNRA